MKPNSAWLLTGARALFAAVCALLFASTVSGGALALSVFGDVRTAELSEAEYLFAYTPSVNGEYALYAFSADGGEVWASAQIREGGEVIARGEGRGELCGAWLAAGTEYTVRVTGSGNVLLETARRALSRCFSDPLDIDDPFAGGKMLARAGDAHWYRFTAMSDGITAITCVPDADDMQMTGMLFSEDGAFIAAFERVGSACMLRVELSAGDVCYIRLCAPGGGTGYYRLQVEGGVSGGAAFASDAYAATAGGTIDLSAEVTGDVLLWTSDDSDIARVAQDGTVYALSEGDARIRAYGAAGSDVCTVHIAYVPLEGLRVSSDEMTLAAGDDAQIAVTFVPENASERELRYTSDNENIEVDADGVVRAVSEGTSTVTITNASGSICASVRVTVTPAPTRYRALLVSQQNYAASAGSVREGSENSARALEALLGAVRFPDAAYVTRLCADCSRAECVAAIRETFARASEKDISLFYITCHGFYEGGMSCFEFTDGSVMTARELERELRAVPGTVIVLLDCCGSGGAIGETGDDFIRGAEDAFSGAAICGSKYYVLCSAGAHEDSYRVAFDDDGAEGLITAFVRALCDGAGWNISAQTRGAMGADSDYDGEITFGELARYVKARVEQTMRTASALTGATYRQTVRAYPEGGGPVLFKMTEE